jgi:UMF1 family MFS transporter
MIGSSILFRLGLHRRDLRAWAMYDWANSAFVLIIITAVFPLYYQSVCAAGLDPDTAMARYGWTTSVSLLVVAALAPFLGALADLRAIRKTLLGICVVLGVLATAGLALCGTGGWIWALALFSLGNIAVTTSFLFYDSLLPHIASTEEMDRVSAGGYALGYLGSGLLLLVNLAWIRNPEMFGIADAGTATRISFLSVAVWWGLFSVPLFRTVSEPPPFSPGAAAPGGKPDRRVFASLAGTLRDLRGSHRDAFTMLLAVMFYNEGIGTIIRMAAIYAAGIGLPQSTVIIAILLVQFIGVPCAFLFGNLAGLIGTKRTILVGLAVYALIAVLAYRMESSPEFYLLAVLVALVQGGTQALSRSLFASMIPKDRATEFFGFFSVFEKLSGVLGPGLFGIMVWVTGSSRDAILTVLGFFVAGSVLLTLTNVERGRAAAHREA